MDDKYLIESFKKGNIVDFEKLVLKYRSSAVLFAYNCVNDYYMAEDIAQEAFAIIYIKKDKLRTNKNFKAFLYTIIRNKSIDIIRKNKNFKKNINELIDFNMVENNLEDRILRKEELLEVKKCIVKLSKDYRLVLYLYAFEGYTYKEIAEILNKSEVSIRVKIFRIRKKIIKMKNLNFLKGEC
jgi:RNA polymerase sigma-70 factor (ECF subfamily)